jgi:hypothetical protein
MTMMNMSKKSKGAVAAMIAAGALGAGTASASAASTYVASASSLSGSISGGAARFIDGNIVVNCTTSSATISGLSTTTAALPAAFGGVPAPTFGNCTATVAGVPRPVTVVTRGTWSANLSATNYTGTINPPNNGATITLGTCVITVNASNVAATLRNAAGAIPALGSPASRLAVNGTVNVVNGQGCPTGSTAQFIADGSATGGAATGTYGLSGTVTEN